MAIAMAIPMPMPMPMPSVKHNPWSSSLHPIRASAQVPAFVAINILHAATGPMDDGSSPREAAEGCHAVDVASWRAEKDILALGNRVILSARLTRRKRQARCSVGAGDADHARCGSRAFPPAVGNCDHPAMRLKAHGMDKMDRVFFS
ncbi:hypothetical protein T310_5499 [Rasamsonia emersonii CBS 393.64]|uniref:Uncharacterized protein n=1 Tax=Rasamsonia emersonii (strain ATCC 16479 / CBS 393.64 / IMI 116815) TaxID=1408163 RepID=A0A0F4YQU6_RASE3|nr:hypothetical protein T310_5499 [Rasamsonia emersonii CBS 393.64]KKA20480.1 hypothetical protein T310_5499 [Rasamsonia emersonii CBS 393.64]